MRILFEISGVRLHLKHPLCCTFSGHYYCRECILPLYNNATSVPCPNCRFVFVSENDVDASRPNPFRLRSRKPLLRSSLLSVPSGPSSSTSLVTAEQVFRYFRQKQSFVESLNTVRC